jgi:hypothetical protein
MLLPGFRDRRCRRIAHLGTGPIGNGREVANRFLNRLAAGRGIHFQPGGNIEEQTARPAPSGQKLRIRLGVTRPGDCVDLGHRGYKIVTGKLLEQRVAPLIERQGVFFKNKPRIALRRRGAAKPVPPLAKLPFDLTYTAIYLRYITVLLNRVGILFV